MSTTINLIKDVSLTPNFSYNGVLYLHAIEKTWVSDTSYAAGGYVKKDTTYGLHYAHNYSGSLSLAYNPTIYGMFMFKPNSKIHAIRHVIRPSISVAYSPKMGVKKANIIRYIWTRIIRHRNIPYLKTVYTVPPPVRWNLPVQST